MEEHKKEDCIIYGVNTCNHITPEDVRDAIMRCFAEAHSEALENLGEGSDVNKEDLEAAKRVNVEMIVKKFFQETGGDFDHPTKEALFKVAGKLALYAKSFRQDEIIKQHFEEVMFLIDKID